MPIGVVCFDLALPPLWLNHFFFVLEPLIVSLQNIAKE
jgi:hypothetical protein